jgi:hypothetical protein
MRITQKSVISFAAALGVLLGAVPALAHHGVALYDARKTVTIMGTVTAFSFANPHSVIFLSVKDHDGSIEKWQAELTSPNFLGRAGWNSHTLKMGDEVTISGHPAKTGAKSAWVTKVILPGGRELDSDGEN